MLKERKNLTGDLLTPTIVATVVSFVVGYASIAFLIKFLQKRGTAPFVAYRVILGLVILGAVLAGKVDPMAGAEEKPEKPAVAMNR
jgi:undecaprenyl-diphosphatase